MMVAFHLEMKRRKGYSQEEIDRKRLSLEGVLVPVTAKWNVGNRSKQRDFRKSTASGVG